MSKGKKLSERLLDVLRERYKLARTFKPNLQSSWQFRLGFTAGVDAVNDKLRGLIQDVAAYEKTAVVQAGNENDIIDALQWNLRQYRKLIDILACERESTYQARAVKESLERCLRGERMKEVKV